MHSDSFLWPNIRDAFFKDLSVIHERSGPWHAVFFTGDLVQSGSAPEFQKLDQVLNDIWASIRELGSEPLLFTVPGNHDLARPNLKEPAVRLLSKWNDNDEIHEEFWNDENSEYRKIVDGAFANYTNWKTKSPINRGDENTGLLPGDFSSVIALEAGRKVGLVGLNTASLQLTDGNYKGKLAWDQRQFHRACGGDGAEWNKGNDISILLSHHGPSWLNERSQGKASAEIAPAGRFAVHLFGHMHEPKLLEQAEGGGPLRHYWQGKSLFGLEHYGSDQKEIRLHGYSAGAIFMEGETAIIKRWPRTARFHQQNGWEMIPDHEQFSLGDDGSTKRALELKPENSETMNPGRTTAAGSPISSRTKASGRISPTRSNRTMQHWWGWPRSEPSLKPYCEAVAQAHGHIRFVEIPYLKDVSDVELDNLFVHPRLSQSEIHPDLAPYAWPKCSAALEVLADRPQLVLLGDPGSGKSTLVSCLSWQLCKPQPAKQNVWTTKFGGHVPVPMILRELSLKADLSWEGLIDAFLEHRIGKLLQNRKTIESLLKEGRAIVLLDGLDEIGNLTIRRKLRAAVHIGMAAYPKSRWIMTSRIVGYEQVPFHYRVEQVPSGSAPSKKAVEHRPRSKRVRTTMAEVFYQSPFNDEQIQEFSANWYSQHENEQEIVASNSKDFIQAIRENDGTQRLARIPYLLTLMALVHHKHARLPHGRTELYERIATAYLESIDLRRQLNLLPYSLAQKKRWLADVAYRMQLRRIRRGSESVQGDLLASKADVQKWLRASMSESGARDSRGESEVLLKYFAQRSGLLVPRGEGKFAFMHLSLQEYFAASFLEPRLTASRFSPKNSKLEPSNDQLRTWVNSDAWRETFVLLFELLSTKSTSETEAFLEHLFKKRLERNAASSEFTAAALLAELVTDPFVVLSKETAREMRQLLWRWVFRRSRTRQDFFWTGRGRLETVLRNLLRETHGDLRAAWKAASIGQPELRVVTQLDLSGCTSLSDLAPLIQMKKLSRLNLRGCGSVSDLTPIFRLKKLNGLNLENCQGITSLEGIAALKELDMLTIGVGLDLSPLSRAETLKELHMHHSTDKTIDLTPLAGLMNLQMICAPEGPPIRISQDLERNPEKVASAGVRKLLKTRFMKGAKNAAGRRIAGRNRRKAITRSRK
jgi:hypothetical protein